MNRSTLVLPLLLVLCLGVPALTGAQTGAEQPPAGQPDQDPMALLRQALDRAGAGHPEEGIALLEPLKDSSDTPPPVLATLGALYLQVDRPADAYAILAPMAEAPDANAAVLYNAGRAAMGTGKVAQAEKLFERSVDLQPGTPASRELGLIRGLENRYRQALTLLLPWAKSHPDDKEARLAAAFAAIRLNRPPDAEELLSDLPQTDPQVRLAWGNLLLLKNDPPAAVATLRPLLDEPESKVPPEMANDTRNLLADAYIQIGKAEEAIDLLKDHAKGPAGHLQLGRAYYQSGDVAKAIETLQPFAEPVLGHSPDDNNPRWPVASDIVQDFGRWLLAAGRPADAVPYLHLATQAHPRDKEAWQAYGQALAATGKRDEARQALQKFQEVAREEGSETERINRIREARDDPTGAKIDRARQMLAQGQADQALKLLEGEIELAPNDLRPRLLASRALLILGRPQEALDQAQKALTLAPSDPNAVYQRGTVNMALKNFDAAETDLRHAIELAPNHVPALNDLAVVLLVEGKRDEARSLLEKVLEIRPDDPQAKANLDRLEKNASS